MAVAPTASREAEPSTVSTVRRIPLEPPACTEPHPPMVSMALLLRAAAPPLASMGPESPTESTAPRQTLACTASLPRPAATQSVCLAVELMACRAAAAPTVFTPPEPEQVPAAYMEPQRPLPATELRV